MGYETLSIFNFEPVFGEAQQARGGWTTEVSTSESGKEYRRSRWTRPISNFSFQFDLHYPRIADLLLAFYTARKGAYEKFWLPSFRRETFLVYQATLGVAYIDVRNPDFFSIVSDLNGNFVSVRTVDNSKIYIGQVTGITNYSGYSRMAVSPSVNATFPPNSLVEVAFKARFSSDVLEEAITVYSHVITSEFREVK
jgi:hypothetical protein